MPHYLYLLRPARPEMVDAPTEEERRIVAEHFEHLERMRDDGRLFHAGRTAEGGSSLGIVIFRAADDVEARAVMEADPAVVAGVMRATPHPYRPALTAEADLEDRDAPRE